MPVLYDYIKHHTKIFCTEFWTKKGFRHYKIQVCPKKRSIAYKNVLFSIQALNFFMLIPTAQKCIEHKERKYHIQKQEGLNHWRCNIALNVGQLDFFNQAGCVAVTG